MIWLTLGLLWTAVSLTEGACTTIFEAQHMSEVFRGTCDPITFPCADQTLQPVPGNCSFYYQCSDRRVYKCPCGEGTAFDVAAGTCIDPFYANCTCPLGYTPPTTPTATTTTQAPTTTQSDTTPVVTTASVTSTTPATTQAPTTAAAPVAKGINGGLVGGVTSAVVALVVVAIVVVVVVRKRRSRRSGESYYDNASYARQNETIKSTSASSGSADYFTIHEVSGIAPTAAPNVPTGRETMPPLDLGQEASEKSSDNEEQDKEKNDNEEQDKEKKDPTYDNHMG